MQNTQNDRSNKILCNAPEPPVNLTARILRSIEKEERKKAFRQVVVSGMFLFISLGATIMSTMDFDNELSRSGFLSFISLFRSDFSFAIANIHEVFLSLAESFPAISAAFCLASIGFAICFAARLISKALVVRHSKFTAPSFS
jgi:hypothetical protein